MRFLIAAGVVALLIPWARAGSSIRLKSRTIDVSSQQIAAPGRHYILQFRSHPGPEIRTELVRRGIRVLGYVPDSGLMVSSPSAPDLEGLEVTWSGSLAASDKLSPELGRSAYTTYVAIFHPDISPREARFVVRQHGFWTLDRPGLLPGHLLVSGPRQRLPELAESDEVAYLLPASLDLISGRRVMGCAGAVTAEGSMGEYVEVSPGWAKAADGGVNLQYVFQTLTPKLEENAVRGEIARAFAEWARFTNLSFSPGSDPTAARTVNILFAHGLHGDPYAFDGPGGMLAHTFYPAPPNPEPVAGDMHLDADEDWHIGDAIDLFSVALHEAGHALGLGHTSRPGSVMYPDYHLLTGLSEDDIAGIRELYGGADPAPPIDPPQPPRIDPQPPAVAPPDSPPPSPAHPAPGLDHTPPSLRIASPGFSIVATSEPSIQISGIATDDVGVTTIKWMNSTGASGSATGRSKWTARVPLLIGNNTVIVRAYDLAGNSAWRAITVVRR